MHFCLSRLQWILWAPTALLSIELLSKSRPPQLLLRGFCLTTTRGEAVRCRAYEQNQEFHGWEHQEDGQHQDGQEFLRQRHEKTHKNHVTIVQINDIEERLLATNSNFKRASNTNTTAFIQSFGLQQTKGVVNCQLGARQSGPMFAPFCSGKKWMTQMDTSCVSKNSMTSNCQ